MPTIDSLSFNTTFWNLREESERRRIWTRDNQEVLAMDFFESPPDIPSLFAVDELRNYFRQQAAQLGGAIISVDVVHVQGMCIGQSVFKYPQPDSRMGFVGSLVLPYRDFSYVVRVQSSEVGTKGEREAMVMAHVARELPPETDIESVWMADPYDPTHSAQLMRCLADDVRWDSHLPDHPLSRVRSHLVQLIPSLKVTREVRNSVPFRGTGP